MMDVGKEAQAEQPWRVLTGGDCFRKTHGGIGPWEWLHAHPALEDGFSRAMAEVDSMGDWLPGSWPAPPFALPE